MAGQLLCQLIAEYHTLRNVRADLITYQCGCTPAEQHHANRLVEDRIQTLKQNIQLLTRISHRRSEAMRKVANDKVNHG